MRETYIETDSIVALIPLRTLIEILAILSRLTCRVNTDEPDAIGQIRENTRAHDNRCGIHVSPDYASAGLATASPIYSGSGPFQRSQTIAQDVDLIVSTLLQAKQLIHYPHQLKEDRNKLSGTPAAINVAIDLVRERFRDPDLSVTTLATAANLSERHLRRLFKESTGRAFCQYLRQLRIEEATWLLMDTDYGIKTIASMVGYLDPSRFGEDFRASTGYTPSELRAKMLNVNT